MRLAIKVITVVTLLLALPILLAGPGTRLGLWDYGLGLTMIREVSAPKTLFGGVALSPLFTAAALSIVAAIAAAVTRRPRSAMFAVLAALIAGGAGMVPIKMKAAFEGNPFIHEITTDFENPPQIIAAAEMPRKNPAEYRGGDPVPRATDNLTVAEAQRNAFPDIQPIIANAELAAAAAVAKDVVVAMGMDILVEGPADDAAGSGWRIEAVATSKWFGFKDDFIVRLTPLGDGKTKVDLRSKSRVGGSDLGANAARVRDFTKRFNAAIQGPD
jgi:uncharacterized protein (DUF1499 family)